MKQAKYLELISSDIVELSVFECECGFHLGLDATYLDQVDGVITIDCPSCGHSLVCDEEEKPIPESKLEDTEYSVCTEDFDDPILSFKALNEEEAMKVFAALVAFWAKDDNNRPPGTEANWVFHLTSNDRKIAKSK